MILERRISIPQESNDMTAGDEVVGSAAIIDHLSRCHGGV